MSPAVAEIFDIERQIFATREAIKDFDEQIEGQLGDHAAYKKVQAAQRQLEAARAELKSGLLNDPDYNNLLEQRADRAEDLAALKSTLSSMLTAYFAETKERQIEVDNTTSREVIITGRLGKAHPTQLRLTP